MTMQPNSTIAIIGGGVAGVSAALGARSMAPEARIILFSQESSRPYDRTSLSKQMLAEGAAIDDFPVLSAEEYEAQSIELHQGVTVAGIDTENRVFSTNEGVSHSYHSLIIATGAEVRLFAKQHSTAADGRVHYLRTEADALRLRSQLNGARRIVVIGGGLIGLEVAAAARARNIAVTVLEAAPVLLGRSCDPYTAEVVERWHTERGVDVRKGCQVSRIEDNAGGEARVQLSQGGFIDADLVVVGIGVVPRTRLAELAGLTVANGIVVDELGRTDQPEVYAAGDVARLPLPGLPKPVRLETWRHAQDHGYAVGRNAAGAGEPYNKAPSFWSDQYGHRIQGVGLIGKTDPGVIRQYDDGSHASFLLDEKQQLTAVIGIDRAKDINAARRLIGTGVRIDPAALADEYQPVARLVKNSLKG